MIRPIWALVVLATCMLMVSGAGIVYTNWTQHRSDQRWCRLMAKIDQPPRPEMSAQQKDAVAELHRLHLSLDC